MSLYLNEPAPWEKKNTYYGNIQLGKDVRQQTEIISQSTRAMMATQMASANAIISSQSRISEGIDHLAYSVEKVEQGIYGLQAAFEWGISEVVWQIEQSRRELRSILEVLSAPLDTQARELRRRAEEAYANGWFDDALEDFLESEKKNRYDFSIHISIGMIYLFHKVDKEKALEYFEKAIKYATPKSNYHTSFALLHKALIKRDFGFPEEAEAAAWEAVRSTPDFSEALYQCAQYNALLNRPEKSLPLIKNAIELDTNYCEKVCSDSIFDPFRNQVNNLFEELRQAESEKARHRFERATKRIEKIDKTIKEIKGVISIRDQELRNCTARITALMERNSYRDYLEANHLIEKLSPITENFLRDTIIQLESLVQSRNREISIIKSEKTEKISDASKKFKWIMILGGIVSVILGFRGCWVRGPGALGGPGANAALDNPLWSFWALIWITALGVAVSWCIYKAMLSIFASRANQTASSDIADAQPTIDKINGHISRLKEELAQK